jgi:hydrogenase maturation protein HypF
VSLAVIAEPLIPQTEQLQVDKVVPLIATSAPVLATGAWFKNTLCITGSGQAYVSVNVGDLDTPEACRAHEQIAYAWLASGMQPQAVAHDLHPDFHSSHFAGVLASELNIPLIPVQHHHAHIAAVCAEHGVTGPVLGLALDGVGLGADGTPWGGELLRVNGAEFQRLGHLRPVALPGGDRAAREPWRMAAAGLHPLGRGDEITLRYAHQPAAATVVTMLQRELNCPRSSSMGRWFDAASGLLGLCDRMDFEAQAAILLEQQAQRHGTVEPLPDGYAITEDGVLDFSPLLGALADGGDAACGAALFHATVAHGLAVWLIRAAAQQGMDTIVLGGGCFLNKVLTNALLPNLAIQGLRVLTARQLAPGDSAISLGQAWVAMQTIRNCQ